MSSRKTLRLLALGLIPAGLAAQHTFTPMDWRPVEQALGRAGTVMAGDVYRVGFPRGDLHVTVGAVAVKPAFALGSWVAFTQTGDSTAMVMGDLVLIEREVEPVIGKLQEGGIEQTALHNHLLHEAPHVLYMHISGRGAPAKLAAAVRAALALTGTPLTSSSPASPAPPLGLDTAQIAGILGAHGRANGGVYQVGVARAERITVDSIELPPAMGVGTAINFQPTPGGTAAITGDFVLLGSEVNPVIQALRANGIAVTALHSHMLGETPRLFFMHFWGNADPLALARGLRAALDRMNVKHT